LLGAAISLTPLVAKADPCRAIPDQGPLPTYLYPGATFTGPVVYVGDGDSLCVDVMPHTKFFREGGAVVPGVSWVEVRLADFYAPELHDTGGPAAKAALERIVKGRQAVCVADHQSYDRIVARCEVGGRSVGDLMRSAGIAEGGRGR
jgi:endonuclease YncB( thermonuclease family)